jgi:hypothetical protein
MWWLVKADADTVKEQLEGVGIGLEDDVWESNFF